VRSFLERRAGAAAGGRGGAGGGRGRGGGTGRAAAAARVKKEEEEEEEEEESKGGRVPRRNAPRKASTASFIVSDDQEEEDEDDYEGEEDSEEDDDDSEEEEEEESDDDDDDDESKAQPPKKKAKRAAATGGRPAATAATSIGESPAVFDNNRRGGGGGGAAAAAANADDAQPSPSIPAVLRLPLGDRRFASVSRLGGVRRLDVREWYLPKEEGGGGGGLKPGLKGISLNAAAVKLLREKTAELDEALAAKRDFSFVLEERAGGGGGAAAAADEGGGGGGSQGGGWQKAPIQKVAATSLWVRFCFPFLFVFSSFSPPPLCLVFFGVSRKSKRRGMRSSSPFCITKTRKNTTQPHKKNSKASGASTFASTSSPAAEAGARRKKGSRFLPPCGPSWRRRCRSSRAPSPEGGGARAEKWRKEFFLFGFFL